MVQIEEFNGVRRVSRHRDWVIQTSLKIDNLKKIVENFKCQPHSFEFANVIVIIEKLNSLLDSTFDSIVDYRVRLKIEKDLNVLRGEVEGIKEELRNVAAEVG